MVAVCGVFLGVVGRAIRVGRAVVGEHLWAVMPTVGVGRVDRYVIIIEDIDLTVYPAEAERVLAESSRSGITPRWQPDTAERAAALREVRARGWALTNEQLAPGIRSVAVPLRDGEGRVIAALNVNAHAAETPLDVLTGQHLPLLLQAAGSISADWAACQGTPQVTVVPGGPAGSGAGSADESS